MATATVPEVSSSMPMMPTPVRFSLHKPMYCRVWRSFGGLHSVVINSDALQPYRSPDDPTCWQPVTNLDALFVTKMIELAHISSGSRRIAHMTLQLRNRRHLNTPYSSWRCWACWSAGQFFRLREVDPDHALPFRARLFSSLRCTPHSFELMVDDRKSTPLIIFEMKSVCAGVIISNLNFESTFSSLRCLYSARQAKTNILSRTTN